MGVKNTVLLEMLRPSAFYKKILNFEAIIIKIGMYVHFDIQKYIPKNNLKNCPKWLNSEKELKLAYDSKNSVFD